MLYKRKAITQSEISKKDQLIFRRQKSLILSVKVESEKSERDVRVVPSTTTTEVGGESESSKSFPQSENDSGNETKVDPFPIIQIHSQ